MKLDVRLYLVTDPRQADLDEIVVAAVAGGVTCVQVRDKSGTAADRRASVARLRAALPASVAVLANDDLAAARAGDGVHVGQSDVDPVTARAALGDHALIGWSISDLRQLDQETQLAACDYVAVSPVWPTPSKADATAPLGLRGVRHVADRLAARMPVVAIGGIDADNVSNVIAAGADGVAVISAICAAQDPGRAASILSTRVAEGLRARGAER